MTTSVLTTQVAVAKGGAQQYFSLLLPKDVARLVGVETSITLHSTIAKPPRQTAGTLRLQATGQPNVCFCGDVKMGTGRAEGLTPGFAVTPATAAFRRWASQPFVGGGPVEPEALVLKGCRMLYGCYTDELGKALKTDLHYTVSFHLWIDR